MRTLPSYLQISEYKHFQNLIAEKAFDSEGLERWVLERESLNGIYDMLSVYGVGEASVFPDLEGIAKFVERYGFYHKKRSTEETKFPM